MVNIKTLFSGSMRGVLLASAVLAAPAAMAQTTITLPLFGTVNAVIDWGAEGANAGCTRVGFATPAGDGSYIVYVAGASGALGGTPLARVQVALDAVKPITDTPVVTNATEVPITIAGTVRFFSGYNTSDNRTAADAAAEAYVNALPLGDTSDPPVVDASGIAAAIYAALPGKVRDIDLSTTDTSLTLGQVAVPTASLTYS